MTEHPDLATDLAADLDLALDLAAQADAVSLSRFRAMDLAVTTKPDRTPVTDADREVERVIREGLTAARPDDGVLGEELGTSDGTGAGIHRQWIIDPIDGTANFLRGNPIWGTLIALAIDGVPVVGVVSSPALEQRWWAARGHGAFTARTGAHHDRDARPLRVSGVETLADAVVSYNSLPGWDDAGRLDGLLALARASWRARAIGDMWSYMLVAEGVLDVAGEFDLQPYDMAALQPIIEEAGGRFTSVDGEEGPWHGSALATNGLLHEEALALVRATGAPS
ncbi:histidinol phosphatase [Microcella daejeonensis]|uniref:Histidinol-phosphatase n=1 Tax=Microcella daejeonensis TaxID=2994971 RepID=A0A9E8S7T9_9MICO|nr:inositol monophosphatase family protein [Microcella daejeonensis]WAB80840.1 histidinol phosphatase [Microcella daejeonensis]WAB83018.1 histidinol phosphatase [Microcella daejeonensis]